MYIEHFASKNEAEGHNTIAPKIARRRHSKCFNAAKSMTPREVKDVNPQPILYK